MRTKIALGLALMWLAGCVGEASFPPDEVAVGQVEYLETASRGDVCTPDTKAQMLAKLADLRARHPRARLPDDATASANYDSVCEAVATMQALQANTSYIAVIFVGAHIDGAVGYAVYDLSAIRARDWDAATLVSDMAYADDVAAGNSGIAAIAAYVHVPGTYDGAGVGGAAYSCRSGHCAGAAGVGWVDTRGRKGTAAFSFAF